MYIYAINYLDNDGNENIHAIFSTEEKAKEQAEYLIDNSNYSSVYVEKFELDCVEQPDIICCYVALDDV